MHQEPDRRFDFIDLFAGIGGFRFGLEPLGGRCVLSVERDRHARITYAAWHLTGEAGRTTNHPFVEDIDDIPPEEVPPHDVLAAGFPCQPFSIAGVSKKSSLGRAHGFADPTQGTMFHRIVRIVEAARPPLIILENVKNLLSHDRKTTWRVIDKSLSDAGYHVRPNVVDARSWVPQHRERVFITAFRKDLVPRDQKPFEMPAAPDGRRRLDAILATGDVDPRYTLTRPLWDYLQAYRREHERRGNGFGYTLVEPTDVARTLSARYYKDGSEILVKRGRKRPRRLTPSEAQALMGFDRASIGRNLRIPEGVSDVQAYRQFGNAVVPAAVNHVADAALRYLEELRTAPWKAPNLTRRRRALV